MKREERLRKVSELMNIFMKRAEVNNSQLGQRAGITRSSVRRLLLGEMLPKEETILKLKIGLRWQDETGVWRELTNDELTKLRNAAGYHNTVFQLESDDIERPDRCIVYSSRYAPNKFPNQWSMRIIELERAVEGNMYTMWGTLPSITRSPDFYISAYEQSTYHQDKVEAYMTAHKTRQEAFLYRLETSTVRHLYSKKGVEDAFKGLSKGGRPQWRFWDIPRNILAKQLNNLLGWLDAYENFEIRLRETEVPGNITILSNNIVLIEFSLAASLQTGNNTNGLELIGETTTAQFTNQFDSFWADKDTVKSRREVIRWLKQLKSSYT